GFVATTIDGGGAENDDEGKGGNARVHGRRILAERGKESCPDPGSGSRSGPSAQNQAFFSALVDVRPLVAAVVRVRPLADDARFGPGVVARVELAHGGSTWGRIDDDVREVGRVAVVLVDADEGAAAPRGDVVE